MPYTHRELTELMQQRAEVVSLAIHPDDEAPPILLAHTADRRHHLVLAFTADDDGIDLTAYAFEAVTPDDTVPVLPRIHTDPDLENQHGRLES